LEYRLRVGRIAFLHGGALALLAIKEPSGALDN